MTTPTLDWHRKRILNMIADLEADLGAEEAREVVAHLRAALTALERAGKGKKP